MTFLNKINKFLRDEDGFLGALGGIIGGISSIFGGKKTQKASVGAANQGFDYLKGNENVTQAQTMGSQASGLLSGLLGLGGDQAAGEAAFGQYRDSTGYQFRVDEGMRGIEGSRAARGILNSGATAKSLNEYSQGMASQEFSNYLEQLGATQATGLQSAYQVGSAGGTAGANAMSAIQQGNQDKQSGLGGLIGGITSIFGF